MGYFDNLKAINVYRESRPFKSIKVIESRALGLLKEYSKEELEAAAQEICEHIDLLRDWLIDTETNEYIDRLCKFGGWELQYLEIQDDQLFCCENVVDLLFNWPGWAPDSPSLPKKEDYSDFDILQDVLNGDLIYNEERALTVHPNKCYAVLAMIKADQAAALLRKDTRKLDAPISDEKIVNQWDAADAITAGNLVIEAMDVISYAERVLSNEELRSKRMAEKEKNGPRDLQKIRSDFATAAINERWKKDPTAEVKKEIEVLWLDWLKSDEKTREFIYGKKTLKAFAEAMLKEFVGDDGNALTTVNTITNKWVSEWKIKFLSSSLIQQSEGDAHE